MSIKQSAHERDYSVIRAQGFRCIFNLHFVGKGKIMNYETYDTSVSALCIHCVFFTRVVFKWEMMTKCLVKLMTSGPLIG